MLITKFNKMIRNKLLWGGFAVIVGISFVFAFSPGMNSRNTDNSSNAMGILYDKEIFYEEFATARFYALGMKNRSLDPEEVDIVKNETWERIAALRTAEKLGISVSDKEIAQAIQRDPYFSDNGAFNRMKYVQIIHTQLQVPVDIFEEYMRQEMILKKLSEMLQSSSWISPHELTERLNNFTDSFTVEYASFSTNDMSDKVKLVEEDAIAFFHENADFFTVPEKISVKYVEFPVADHLSDAKVEEEQVFEYYNENTNEFALTPASTNDLLEIAQYEDVKDEIVEKLKLKAAVFSAKNAGSEFVNTLIPDSFGNTPGFEKMAAEEGRSILTTKFFSDAAELEELGVDYMFVATAFSLDPDDPERSFSDAIIGSNAVYVLSANERQDAYVPEFAEAREKVMPLYESKVRYDTFVKKAEDIGEKIKNSIEKEVPFVKAAKKAGLNTSTTITFSAYNVYFDQENELQMEGLDALVSSVVTKDKGDFIDALPSEDGVIFAYIKDRESGDLSSKEMIRAEFSDTLTQYRARAMYEEWKGHNLKEAGFKDLTIREIDPEDEDIEEEPPEDGAGTEVPLEE